MATADGVDGRTYTLDEYRRLPRNDDFRDELVDGRLVREPPPGAPHGAAVAQLCLALAGWAAEHGGLVLTDTGFVLSRDPPVVRGPDVAWLRPGRERDARPADYFRGAPDLAVEVVSPSNSAADVHRKVLEYFGAGAARVWVVHPGSRTVVVHRSASEARVLRDAGILDAPDLLPGFSLPVSRIFRL